ncbi:MAG: gamma-glutamyl-gamma-aminobutyrate hydrolase family protein [Oscillospiraceae bacterium]
MNKPLIGITAVYMNDGDAHATRTTYINAVRNAGGEAILLPTAYDIESCQRIVSCLDGLLIPGGPDVSPQLYGEQPIPQAPTTRKNEDEFEIALIHQGVKQGKPILGICRGLQVLNVAFGGSLWQDIPSQGAGTVCHKQGMSIRSEGTHLVKMSPHSRLSKIFGSCEFYTNSYHHQAIKALAPEFKVVGEATDGIIEAIENEDGSILAVQWHPECMPQEKAFRDLFSDYINRCKKL